MCVSRPGSGGVPGARGLVPAAARRTLRGGRARAEGGNSCALPVVLASSCSSGSPHARTRGGPARTRGPGAGPWARGTRRPGSPRPFARSRPTDPVVAPTLETAVASRVGGGASPPRRAADRARAPHGTAPARTRRLRRDPGRDRRRPGRGLDRRRTGYLAGPPHDEGRREARLGRGRRWRRPRRGRGCASQAAASSAPHDPRRYGLRRPGRTASSTSSPGAVGVPSSTGSRSRTCLARTITSRAMPTR